MSITLDPDLEALVALYAKQMSVTPESLANTLLRRQLHPPRSEPRDEWERQLASLATDCGVSLPDEAFLAESLYDD